MHQRTTALHDIERVREGSCSLSDSTLHNTTQHNTTQHNTTQHDTRQDVKKRAEECGSAVSETPEQFPTRPVCVTALGK